MVPNPYKRMWRWDSLPKSYRLLKMGKLVRFSSQRLSNGDEWLDFTVFTKLVIKEKSWMVLEVNRKLLSYTYKCWSIMEIRVGCSELNHKLNFSSSCIAACWLCKRLNGWQKLNLNPLGPGNRCSFLGMCVSSWHFPVIWSCKSQSLSAVARYVATTSLLFVDKQVSLSFSM